jgi:hypothetical protein
VPFLPQGGSRGKDIFCSFYLVKNHKFANNAAITEAREKINTDLESLEFLKNFDAGLTLLSIYYYG